MQDLQDQCNNNSSEVKSHNSHVLQLDKQLQLVQEAVNGFQQIVNSKGRELHQLELALQEDANLLQELLDHLGQRDNENLLLLQYSVQDQAKIKVNGI